MWWISITPARSHLKLNRPLMWPLTSHEATSQQELAGLKVHMVYSLFKFWFASHENTQSHENWRGSKFKWCTPDKNFGSPPMKTCKHVRAIRFCTLTVSLRMAISRVRWSFSTCRASKWAFTCGDNNQMQLFWKRKWAILFFLTSGLVWLAWVFAFTTSSSSWRTSIACFCEKIMISKTEKALTKCSKNIFVVLWGFVFCLCVCFSPAAGPSWLASVKRQFN